MPILGGSPEKHTKTIRIPHTWAIGGTVKEEYISPMFLDLAEGQTARVVSVISKLGEGGTVTFDLRRSFVNFGLAQLVATTGQNSHVATNSVTERTVSSGQSLQPVVTTIDGVPKNLTITVVLEYTV